MIKKIKQFMVLGASLMMMAVPVAVPIAMTSTAFAATSCTATDGAIKGALADGVDDSTGEAAGSNCATATGGTDANSKLKSVAAQVVNVLSILVGIVSVIFIIYGGFRYITSGGDSGRVGNAKNTLVYALIGLVIVALAQLIVHYVLSTASSIS